jgi:hypothetical protein
MKKKVLAIMLATLMSATMLANVSNAANEEIRDSLKIIGKGIIIDENEERYDSQIILEGMYRDSNKFKVNLSLVSGDISIKKSLRGRYESVFVGWNHSNVDIKNPKISEYKLGERVITRYENAKKIHAVLFSFIDKNSEEYVSMEIFNDGQGWIHGFIEFNKISFEIAMTVKKIHGSLPLSDLFESKQVKGYHCLNVPFRSQWELLPDYDKASRACGPASAAMIEEWYDGDHPSLLSIWNWRPPNPGWYASDIKDYLESHTSYGFFDEYQEGTLEACKSYCKLRAEYWPVAIMIEGHSGQNHWVVIDGWDERYPVNSFTINNPSMGDLSTHLHYYGNPWWLYPNDRSFEVHSWEKFGEEIRIVW